VLVPLMPSLGLPPVMAIAAAVVLGGLGQVLIQWPPLARQGFRYSTVFDPGDHALQDVVVLMGPGTIGLEATQVNIFVNTLLSTSRAAIIVNVLLILALVGSLGFRGLALATSKAALADGGLLVLLLRRRLDGIEGERLMIVLSRVLAASAAMAVAAWGIEYLM